MRNDQKLYGRAVIETLADTYRQLFVSPRLGGKENILMSLNAEMSPAHVIFRTLLQVLETV